MRLRPRQSLFVERSLAALCDHGNTLSIASTGFGKTIALSAVVAKSLEGSDAKACILAHRDELTAQNRAKFSRVAPDISTSVVDAEAKSWAGRATFAMVPTLSRPANLAAMAHRVDRLRLCGNGVVPLVAAHALRTLAAELLADR